MNDTVFNASDINIEIHFSLIQYKQSKATKNRVV